MAKGKTPSSSEMVHLGFRGTPELTARIDGLAEQMSERIGGVKVSRSQVLELLVQKGLPLLEAQYEALAAGKTETNAEAEAFAERVLALIEARAARRELATEPKPKPTKATRENDTIE